LGDWYTTCGQKLFFPFKKVSEFSSTFNSQEDDLTGDVERRLELLLLLWHEADQRGFCPKANLSVQIQKKCVFCPAPLQIESFYLGCGPGYPIVGTEDLWTSAAKGVSGLRWFAKDEVLVDEDTNWKGGKALPSDGDCVQMRLSNMTTTFALADCSQVKNFVCEVWTLSGDASES